MKRPGSLVTAALTCVGLITPTLYAQAYTGSPFSATGITMATGDEIKLYVDGSRLRADLPHPQGGPVYDLIFLDIQKEYTVDPSSANKCFGQAPTAKSIEEAIGDYSWPLDAFRASDANKVTQLGDTTVQGLKSTVEEIDQVANGTTTKIKVWISKDLGLPLQYEATDSSGQVSKGQILKNVRLGHPTASLLAVPPSCAGK